MERIRLTKREKAVMRILSNQGYEALSEFDASAVRSLSERGFVKAAFTEGGGVEDAKLSTMGKEYLRDYLSLRNPFDWEKVAAILLFVTVFAIVVKLVIKFNEG